eukprot:782519_1
MHLSSIAFILHITCICAIGTAQTNITFKSSPIILEAGLFGHLTTIYNDSTLYIFGGNTESGSVLPYVPSQSVYTLQLTSPDTVYHYQIPTLPDWTYVEDGAPMDFLGDPDTTFMNPTAISCAFPHTNCHARIDDTIYAFIPNDNNDNLFVYKYNVITKSFPSGTAWDNTNYANQITQMLAYENEYENVKYYVDGCIVSDGAEYIYSFGTIQSSASTYHGFKYNALLDMFILLEFDGLFNRGYAVGCNIDIHNANIYVFGGTFYNGFEMDIIEKWNINDDTWSVVDDGMEHKRSHLTVHVLTSAHENYFIIMGGTTQEAKQSIEIFDANIDEMVLTLSITTDLIRRYAFSTFIWNDLLYIHGGAVFNNVNLTLSIKSDFLCVNITDAIRRFYVHPPTSVPSDLPTLTPSAVPSSTPTDAPTTMTQSPSGAPTSQSVSPTWTPTLGPTLASFDPTWDLTLASTTTQPTRAPTDECFERGMCALGYMDQTNGNTEYLLCGSQCIGGAYLTDLDCNCACVLVGLCPQLCYSDEYCYSYDIYPSNASTVTFDPVYIQHVHDNRNTTFNVYVKPHTLPCIQPSITFEYELIVEYLIITNEDASWSTTCSEFNIDGCDMWSTCLQSVPIGTAQIDADTLYKITIQDTADWAMCAHGYDINARLTLTCQGTVPPSKSPTRSPTIFPTISPTSPTENPTISPTSLTQSPTNFPTFSPTLITNNPTHFPTIPPTTPTAEPTPHASALCPTDQTKLPGNCVNYYVKIFPGTTTTVNLQSVPIGYGQSEFNEYNIYYTATRGACIEPSITFEYQSLFQDQVGEYYFASNRIYIRNNQDALLQTCRHPGGYTYEVECGAWETCLSNYSVSDVNQIDRDATYRMQVSGSFQCWASGWGGCCWSLVMNARLHFECKGTFDPVPTAYPTPEPTQYGGSLCSTSPYTWCYYIDLYPGDPNRTTTVYIQHKKTEYALHPSGTYFNLYFTMRNGTCLTPLIDFEYEPIDMDSDDEYILITGTAPTNVTQMLQKCSYTNNMCGQMTTCIDQMRMYRQPLYENEKYLVELYLSGNVDPLCDDHEYIINARLHWTCTATVEPTQATSHPTTHPSHPTNSPIPTVHPSRAPSSAPSQPTSNDDGIVFYPLSIQLPQSISNHISVVYEDRLHIIGGLLSYKSIETMTNIYNNDNHNLTTIHDFDFEIYTNILPSWKHTGPSSIACSHQCYVTINDTVFIQVLNDDVSDLFYVKYSLSEATFEPNDYDDYTDSYVDTLESIGTVESDEMPQNLMYQCVVYDEKRFIYSFGSNLMSDLLPQALRYDTWDNRWSRLNITNDDSIIFLWYPTQASSCVYCTIDSAFVYTFGGRYKGRDFGTYIEVPFIYKYNIVTQTRSVLDAALTYERSFSTAAPIKLDPNETPQYVVIYGGTTAISKSYIEIFDVVNEIMIHYDVNSNDNVVNSINFNLLNANLMNYSSFLYNDTLCINGGVSSEYDFQILNLSDIFDVDAFYPFTQDPVDYSCIHTHVMNGGFSIPEYIYRNTNQMMMNTIPLDDQEKNYRIMFQSSPSTFSLAKLGKQCPDTYGSEYDCIAISTTVWALYSGNIPWGDWTLDISPIQWNIANKDDITLYWMSWTDSTIFKVGIGDVYNDERLTFAASDQVNYPLINDIDWIAIYPIQDGGDIKFIFYSNECELSVDLLLMNDSFSVGDRLLIEWNLTRANALYSNVWIHSDDMKLNYTMRINENEFNESECILSSPHSSLNDSLCEEGMRISELTTYDVNQNAYQIVVSTLHPILTSNDDSGVKITQNVFAFQRSIMHINLSMNTDDTISPQRPLGFSIQYDESSPTQQHAHITVIFDDRLQISDDNTAQMTIDFYTDSCQITYAKKGIYKTQACLDEFVIPSDMFIANIGNDNAYSITMQSVDSVLSKQDFIVSRNVQTVSVEIMNKNRSVSLGDKIEIEFAVIDYDIYQPASIIYVTSAELGINAITRIAYTNDTNMTCEIEDPVIDDKHTCSHCICDVSLHNLKASSINSTLNMQFNSFDTYLTQYDVPIYVDHCPIGYGLQSGSANDTIPCTQCALNTINIHRNSECIGCNKIDGIECIGQSKMQITFNYWTHFDAQQNAIISSYCPVGRCCRSKDGCLRDISSSSSSSTLLCAKHRDESIPLCGGCIAGYSEVFGTANCSQCRRNHYELLLFPFFIAMVYVLFLAHCNTKTETNFDTSQAELSYANLFAKDDMEAIKIALLRPMVYLFEAISIITIQTGYAFYLQPLLDVFSMQFIIAEYGGASSGLCLTKHLTAIGKLLWYLFFPFSMLMILFIYYIVYEKLTVFKFKRFKPNFLNAFWYTILIMLGTFLDKMFKILACRRLDSDAIGTVHFYAGNVMCYGLEWTLSLCTLILL